MTHASNGTGRLVGAILLLVLLGVPFVAYLWETLNRLLSGIVEPVRLLIALPVAVVFLLLLRYIARTIDGWYAARAPESDMTP